MYTTCETHVVYVQGLYGWLWQWLLLAMYVQYMRPYLQPWTETGFFFFGLFVQSHFYVSALWYSVVTLYDNLQWNSTFQWIDDICCVDFFFVYHVLLTKYMHPKKFLICHKTSSYFLPYVQPYHAQPTLVSSCALARLSTAMAKKTLRRVSDQMCFKELGWKWSSNKTVK